MRPPAHHALRLGLCCQFARAPIKFRTTTATAMMRLPRADRLSRLADLCRLNADALLASLNYCAQHGIGAFRINSQILPVKTHPQVGYDLRELPQGEGIIARFRECGAFARRHAVRLSFHPDQFVVLNSPNAKTLLHSLAELNYQAEVAEWVGADTINIHAGGAYGDKIAALRTLRVNIERLPVPVRSRLTLENDDRIFTPANLLPVCRDVGVPLVYDVHHHRCLADGLTVEAATERVAETWNREPLFHISSPLEGWRGPRPERHHDFITPSDFPKAWRHCDLTVEVEAKSKELAVLRLLEWLRKYR
ncbi:MAG TPA: UV DNA damage repair endonuclease UvsE [Verrucomicrobiae bacterium]